MTSLNQSVAPASPGLHPERESIDTALGFARSLDARALDEWLRRAAARLGIPVFIESVAVPFLRRVGDEWYARRISPAEEHVASSTVHDIIVETMRACARENSAPKLVVSTLTHERHVIGAALVGAAAAMEGWGVVYLGADVPATDIARAARICDARLVAISSVYVDDRERVLGEIGLLRTLLPSDVRLIAGGSGAVALAAATRALGVPVESTIGGLFTALEA